MKYYDFNMISSVGKPYYNFLRVILTFCYLETSQNNVYRGILRMNHVKNYQE